MLVSGTGRSLENLLQLSEAGELDCEIALVISNKSGALALDRAREHGVPASVIDPERALDTSHFSRAIFDAVREHDCGSVVLAGFLRLLEIPEDFRGRVLNIHPALLPAFGGKGYYGDRLHAAVLQSGVQFTGCTVHYVDDQYDHGPILLQRCVAVQPDDTLESLAARVFEEEKIALPEAIRVHLARGA